MTVMAAEPAVEAAAGESAATTIGKSAARKGKPRTIQGERGPRGRTGKVATTARQPRERHLSSTINNRGRRKVQYQGKKSSGNLTLPKLGKAKGKAPQVSTLIAEWLIAVIVILWGIFSGNKSYEETIANAMWRLTALSGVFFVLALVMRGKNTGRVAVAMGALIDLALILEATNHGEVKKLAGVFAGKGTKTDTGDTAPETIHTVGEVPQSEKVAPPHDVKTPFGA